MPAGPSWSMPELLAVIEKTWGFHSLRPLQEAAMHAVLDGRDSLVVLPTGGGKSLCYQAPAVLRGGTTVVVSPLIALMKDQVDGLPRLRRRRRPSSTAPSPTTERCRGQRCDLPQGAVRLLFVSPERLVLDRLSPRCCSRLGVRTFAIDEAHCISHWGHDFRPEYRQLARLRELFPDATVHAYTATATEQVRARHRRAARPARAGRAGRQLRPAEPDLPRAAAARRARRRCWRCSTATGRGGDHLLHPPPGRGRAGGSLGCAAQGPPCPTTPA